MKTYVAGTVFALFLGVTGLAQAGQLVSPSLPTRHRAVNIGQIGHCRIRNVGTSAVTVKVNLFSNNSPVNDLDLCNGKPLQPGATCFVSKFLPDDSYVACSVTAGNVANLRGTLDISEDPTHVFNVILSEDLR
jgi:hypothetical protein